MTNPLAHAVRAMRADPDPFRTDPSRLGLLPAPSVEERATALVEAMEREWSLMAAADRACDESPRAVAAFEAAYARRSALLDEADALPATCRAARHAKVLSLVWLTAVQVPRHALREDLGGDERLAFDVDVALSGGAA